MWVIKWLGFLLISLACLLDRANLFLEGVLRDSELSVKTIRLFPVVSYNDLGK